MPSYQSKPVLVLVMELCWHALSASHDAYCTYYVIHDTACCKRRFSCHSGMLTSTRHMVSQSEMMAWPPLMSRLEYERSLWR